MLASLQVSERTARFTHAPPRRGRSPSQGAGQRAAGAGHSADQALVAGARAGDRAALRQLIDRHQQGIYRLALSLVKDPEAARDVVQESLLKMHQHLGSFKGDAAFSTWLYRITYNVAIDALRKRQRTNLSEVDQDCPEAQEAQNRLCSEDTPQRTLLRGEFSAHLTRAVDQLTPQHRAILVLREVEDLSYEELAVTLGIPKGTVMSRLFHARKKLQAALGGYVEKRSALHV